MRANLRARIKNGTTPVLVLETTGNPWKRSRTDGTFFYCTDPEASVAEIVETFADRAAIEQVFRDAKEVWGSGQQQVRNLWTNIGVWHLNLWMHTLTELWAWNRSEKQLTHRDDSPWDRVERRPSHADRRKALQAACLAEELSHRLLPQSLNKQFRTLLKRLLRIAV